MLGEVVGIFKATRQMNKVISIGNLVFYPVETHFNGFGAALLEGVIGNSGSAGIIDLDGRDSLWVAHFFHSSAKGGTIFSIVEKGTKLASVAEAMDFKMVELTRMAPLK